MLRRSARLESIGYYNIWGEPSISYKETMYRIFRRRKSNDQAERSSSSSRRNWGPSMFKLMIYLFFTLHLCFGLAYWLTSPTNISVDSGRSESPLSPHINNKDFNRGCEERTNSMTELQDKVVIHKKNLDYLLPISHTMPNFALDSLGASVLCYLSSKTYTSCAGMITFFGIPIWKSSVNPETVIQGHSSLVPGRCWPFGGGRGHLYIALSHPVNISHVTLGHISKDQSPSGTIHSAPKEFSVYGMETLNDEGTPLGSFLYDQDGDSLQTFQLPDRKKGIFEFIKLQIESNWGQPDFSCLYNFQVHGKLAG